MTLDYRVPRSRHRCFRRHSESIRQSDSFGSGLRIELGFQSAAVALEDAKGTSTITHRFMKAYQPAHGILVMRLYFNCSLRHAQCFREVSCPFQRRDKTQCRP